ncbi:MAG: DUF4145 domain-containing protein [Candidatus Methanoperedens sp.]|nr:DUF4145 domain-containing protein [Candidatus Methanoperedens sp.]
MKCPHCLVEVHLTSENRDIGADNEFYWKTSIATCPHCKKCIIWLEQYSTDKIGNLNFIKEFLVYPKGISRAPLSPVVPDIYAQEYKEACLVLSDSAKASAALSRRCLQNLLRNVQKVKSSDLSKQIDEVLGLKVLPSHLSEAIDAVRNIGNFAAHPIKSTNTGAIVDVEQGEAEWLLDVLEGLFDFYFVQPDILQKKKAALNQKLKDAGKPPMK